MLATRRAPWLLQLPHLPCTSDPLLLSRNSYSLFAHLIANPTYSLLTYPYYSACFTHSFANGQGARHVLFTACVKKDVRHVALDTTEMATAVGHDDACAPRVHGAPPGPLLVHEALARRIALHQPHSPGQEKVFLCGAPLSPPKPPPTTVGSTRVLDEPNAALCEWTRWR